MDEVYYGPFKLYESEASKARKRSEAAQVEMEMEKRRLELDKLRREDPQYQMDQSSALAQRIDEITSELKSIDQNTDINEKEIQKIASASTPLPSDQFAGPVLPVDQAMRQRMEIDQRIEANRRNQVGLRAQLETARNQLGKLS